MLIEDTFKVGVPVAEAWRVLTDVERIAPCMPGAELQEIEGNEFRGIVKVKVGPITAQYKGAAQFEQLDEAARHIVLKASGRDTRGQGNASATVTVKMTEMGAETQVHVATDLNVTGKVAQFGRGVMADVSSKLLGQFVACLESDLLSGHGGGAAAATDSTASGASGDAAPANASSAIGAAPTTNASTDGVRKINSRPAEPVDLMEVGGAPVLKRLLPIGVVAFLFLLLRRGRRGRCAKS